MSMYKRNTLILIKKVYPLLFVSSHISPAIFLYFCMAGNWHRALVVNVLYMTCLND